MFGSFLAELRNRKVARVATPIDLTRLITINKPNMRIGYRLAEEGNDFVDTVTRVST